MNFEEWSRWRKTIPLSLKWFVLLILVRPFADGLYFLKDVSPLLSPLYVLGVLTPVLIGLCFLFGRPNGLNRSGLDMLMLVWAALLAMNAALALLSLKSLLGAEIGIKFLTPPLLYFYLRRFVRGRTDVRGILTTFLYSATVPAIILLFERFVGPIRPAVQTRGFERFEGMYADVMTYAVYFSCAFLIAAYFFLDRRSPALAVQKIRQLVVVGAVMVVALFSMHHAASWAVVAGLSGLLIIGTLNRRHIPAFVFVLVMGVGIYFTLGGAIGTRAQAMFQTDVAVLEGDREVQAAFHGRMSRWLRYLEVWEKLPLSAKIVGVAASGTERIEPMVLNGMHNDYLRIGFASGALGLFFYLLLYPTLFLRSLGREPAEAFLIRGGGVLILLYSVTTLPTLYPGLMYVGMTIMAFAASPKAYRAAAHPNTSRPPRPGGPVRMAHLAPQSRLQL